MTAKPPRPALSSRNWLGKASAGLVLGFVLALGLAGLTYWAIGAGEGALSTKAQFTMWLMAPVWALVLSFCFLFRSGPRAWAVLGLACALVWLALFATGALA
ncbi:hypothetical protein MTR62_05035 [Novosphingobium sp. 1949]|uniref:Iron uptake protein n=1 Tax=Novosphingobium organovorum TaxID=2930092 RepID=A0ABT0BB96_9SPHN|nr:hypothetical protein [Novosphingobium organovorum]MCJ2182069.1 hypothetical protein [Novosphingobium organovorum]